MGIFYLTIPVGNFLSIVIREKEVKRTFTWMKMENVCFIMNLFLILTGSKSAPQICYNEVHSHKDMFGYCGLRKGKRVYCGWRYVVNILMVLFLCSFKF